MKHRRVVTTTSRHAALRRRSAARRSITGNRDHTAWDGSQLDPPALLSGVTVVIMSPRKPVTVRGLRGLWGLWGLGVSWGWLHVVWAKA